MGQLLGQPVQDANWNLIGVGVPQNIVGRHIRRWKLRARREFTAQV
jgi:hypothetical protein